MRRSRGIAVAIVLALAATGLAGCGVGASRSATATFPPQTFGPGRSASAAVAQTRGEIARALAAAGFQVRPPQVPFRPPEATALADAPREVVQVVLRDDPGHGFVSIYDLGDRQAATAAGEAQARYVASGPGRVQFPPDTRFVVRQVGTTVLFYAWSPANAGDPDAGAVEDALRTVGTEIAVPL